MYQTIDPSIFGPEKAGRLRDTGAICVWLLIIISWMLVWRVLELRISPDIVTGIAAAFGAAIGTVGGLFAAAEISAVYGSIRAVSRWTLVFSWGTIFTLLAVGGLMTVMAAYNFTCPFQGLAEVLCGTICIYIYVLPLPVLFGLGWLVNRRIWRAAGRHL